MDHKPFEILLKPLEGTYLFTDKNSFIQYTGCSPKEGRLNYMYFKTPNQCL